jgi:hypothetical protein
MKRTLILTAVLAMTVTGLVFAQTGPGAMWIGAPWAWA